MNTEWESILCIHWWIECPRTLAAIELLKQDSFDILIACWWVSKNWATEAEIIENKLLNEPDFVKKSKEFDEEWIDLILEQDSFDTWENIQNILKLIDIDKVSKLVFLTSHRHAERIELIFKLIVKYELIKKIGVQKAKQLLDKAEFVNAEEILMQDIIKKDIYQRNKIFFDNFFAEAYSLDTTRREKMLRFITRLWIWKYRFWLKILNILARKQRKNLDKKIKKI